MIVKSHGEYTDDETDIQRIKGALIDLDERTDEMYEMLKEILNYIRIARGGLK